MKFFVIPESKSQFLTPLLVMKIGTSKLYYFLLLKPTLGNEFETSISFSQLCFISVLLLTGHHFVLYSPIILSSNATWSLHNLTIRFLMILFDFIICWILFLHCVFYSCSILNRITNSWRVMFFCKVYIARKKLNRSSSQVQILNYIELARANSSSLFKTLYR